MFSPYHTFPVQTNESIDEKNYYPVNCLPCDAEHREFWTEEE